MNFRAFAEMLVFAGLPFVITAAVTLWAFSRRKAKIKKRSEGRIAQWAKRNAMSICFGGAFLAMLVIAAGMCILCARLSVSVRVYYAVSGGAMGICAGAALSAIKKLKN